MASYWPSSSSSAGPEGYLLLQLVAHTVPALRPARRRWSAFKAGLGSFSRLARWFGASVGDIPGRGLLCVFVLIVVATALIGLRAPVVRRVPALAVVYEAVGLPVNLAGLALRDVRARIVRDGNRRVLVTEGQIVNIRREENRVPSLALAVRGPNERSSYAWTAPAPKTRLGPGEAVAFRARLAAPPEEGVAVVVRFVSSEPLATGLPGLADLRLASGADDPGTRPEASVDIPNPGKMP